MNTPFRREVIHEVSPMFLDGASPHSTFFLHRADDNASDSETSRPRIIWWSSAPS